VTRLLTIYLSSVIVFRIPVVSNYLDEMGMPLLSFPNAGAKRRPISSLQNDMELRWKDLQGFPDSQQRCPLSDAFIAARQIPLTVAAIRPPTRAETVCPGIKLKNVTIPLFNLRDGAVACCAAGTRNYVHIYVFMLSIIYF
jgi:hypothetical protein